LRTDKKGRFSRPTKPSLEFVVAEIAGICNDVSFSDKQIFFPTESRAVLNILIFLSG
jgi:hypothetical protein